MLRSVLLQLLLWGRWGKRTFLTGHEMQGRAGGVSDTSHRTQELQFYDWRTALAQPTL